MIPTIETLKQVANGFFMMPHQLEAAKNEAFQMIEHINKLQSPVKTQSKKFDFYFSSKYRTLMEKRCHQEGLKYIPMYLYGKEYTEMIEHGKTPLTIVYADLVAVGTGSKDEISYSR